MLRLKSTYETSVEARNFTGVQLIDRNDELCILYEKANLQEQTMKQGEIAIQQKDEDIRMLKLQLAEVQRQIEVSRHKLPDGPELADKIVQLQQELQMERAITKQHCDELEDPKNMDRWRELQGDDPDSEQLLAKIQVLEERLNEKKEKLLEKELVLEEVTTLTGKLRKQAGQVRSGESGKERSSEELGSRVYGVSTSNVDGANFAPVFNFMNTPPSSRLASLVHRRARMTPSPWPRRSTTTRPGSGMSRVR